MNFEVAISRLLFFSFFFSVCDFSHWQSGVRLGVVEQNVDLCLFVSRLRVRLGACGSVIGEAQRLLTATQPL